MGQKPKSSNHGWDSRGQEAELLRERSVVSSLLNQSSCSLLLIYQSITSPSQIHDTSLQDRPCEKNCLKWNATLFVFHVEEIFSLRHNRSGFTIRCKNLLTFLIKGYK